MRTLALIFALLAATVFADEQARIVEVHDAIAVRTNSEPVVAVFVLADYYVPRDCSVTVEWLYPWELHPGEGELNPLATWRPTQATGYNHGYHAVTGEQQIVHQGNTWWFFADPSLGEQFEFRVTLHCPFHSQDQVYFGATAIPPNENIPRPLLDAIRQQEDGDSITRP